MRKLAHENIIMAMRLDVIAISDMMTTYFICLYNM